MLEIEEDDTLEDDLKEQHLEALRSRQKRFLIAAIEKEAKKSK